MMTVCPGSPALQDSVCPDFFPPSDLEFLTVVMSVLFQCTWCCVFVSHFMMQGSEFILRAWVCTSALAWFLYGCFTTVITLVLDFFFFPHDLIFVLFIFCEQ